MSRVSLLIFIAAISSVVSRRDRCDQTPTFSPNQEPSENKGAFKLSVQNLNIENFYMTDQTYVLNLNAMNKDRPFKWFMITVDEPTSDDEDDDIYIKKPDLGSLKTLDTDMHTKYSERCANSVENSDNGDKTTVEVHWLSPKQSAVEEVRIRAMVAENEEDWYVGEGLTILLKQNLAKPIDSPPLDVLAECDICSEARYEVIFKGKWSRVTHPSLYPTKPDENGYGYLIGASHANDYILWEQGKAASPGLTLLAEQGDISEIEREIMRSVNPDNGTRTLIRGRRRHHPDMFKHSHSLFRVDKKHHLFSIAVAMRPSPDWFLGTSNFELCDQNKWLETASIPLFPWDAGTMDGVSYESPRSKTLPLSNVDRVALGSFDRKSPFYQKSLNNLSPFAELEVNKLDEYPLNCDKDGRVVPIATCL